MTDQEIEKLSDAIAQKLAVMLRDERIMVRQQPVNVEELLGPCKTPKKRGWPKGKKRK